MARDQQAEPRLRDFVAGFTRLVDQAEGNEARLLQDGAEQLRGLIAVDDWLTAPCARPGADGYGQHLLHLDPGRRFSVVSFAWAPGQATPIHDHTVWGLVGVLRGAELSQAYVRDGAALRATSPPRRLEVGAVEAVSPRIGDIHRVANAHADRVSVSIHVYGGDIGAVRRNRFDAQGNAHPFVSGYSAPQPQACA
jgi:predicted metal-dependent enzyme (double-stranded beta helix superfamily)